MTTNNEIDTTQFNDTPVIRAVQASQQSCRKLTENSEKKSRKRTDSDGIHESYDEVAGRSPSNRRTKSSDETSNRGRKRKYNTDEERLEARRLQQRAYRERKKAELTALKSNQVEA